MSKGTRGYFVHFSPNLFSEKLQLLQSFSLLQFNTHPIVTIPDDEIDPLVNILERLSSIYTHHDENQHDLARWYLMALFTEVNLYAERKTRDTRNSSATLTQQYKDTLTQHIYSYCTIQEFARILHVTPNHFNKCVQNTLNKTAQDLLNEMLTLEAMSLLKYSDLTIAQIAENLCKSTPSNFFRFFKKQTGITPKAFASQ